VGGVAAGVEVAGAMVGVVAMAAEEATEAAEATEEGMVAAVGWARAAAAAAAATEEGMVAAVGWAAAAAEGSEAEVLRGHTSTRPASKAGARCQYLPRRKTDALGVGVARVRLCLPRTLVKRTIKGPES
jgi:hypothetical protein